MSYHHVVDWLRRAPSGTLVPAEAIASQLEDDLSDFEECDSSTEPVASPSLRAEFWSLPREVRLSTKELAAATGWPKSRIYKRTSARASVERLPHGRDGGTLVFEAGAVQDYIRATELTVVAPVGAPARKATRASHR
jgi:hypothetical protein